MLGIPVAWLSTLVWALAAGLSFLALFLRAGILGVPLGSAIRIVALVQALAALVIGRMDRLPTIALTADRPRHPRVRRALEPRRPAARRPADGGAPC